MTGRKRKGRGTKNVPLLLIALPGLAYLLINNYIPMFGIFLAFKSYDFSKGVFGSPWCGFDNFYYFFSHEDSREAFAIPHDLKILKEVFGLEPGGYRKANAFWNSYAIADLVAVDDDAERLAAQSKRIRAVYDRLSQDYQSGKSDNDIPLN